MKIPLHQVASCLLIVVLSACATSEIKENKVYAPSTGTYAAVKDCFVDADSLFKTIENSYHSLPKEAIPSNAASHLSDLREELNMAKIDCESKSPEERAFLRKYWQDKTVRDTYAATGRPLPKTPEQVYQEALRSGDSGGAFERGSRYNPIHITID